jgi:hypothetical protein
MGTPIRPGFVMRILAASGHLAGGCYRRRSAARPAANPHHTAAAPSATATGMGHHSAVDTARNSWTTVVAVNEMESTTQVSGRWPYGP